MWVGSSCVVGSSSKNARSQILLVGALWARLAGLRDGRQNVALVF